MVWDAEKRGLLGPGKELVEPTSGNTGIALAFVAAARNIPLTLTMPDTMSIERRKLLIAYGANLVLTEGARGMSGAIAKAEEIAASAPGSLRPAAAVQEPRESRHPRGDHRPGNLGRHRRRDRHFRIRRRHRRHHHRRLALHQADQGQSRSFRSRSSRVRVRCITQQRRGQPLKPGAHKIQGIGAGFVPENLDLSLVDVVEQVSNEEAIEYARRLTREEGILSGISCGAAVAVAARIAKRPENKGKTIVVVLPDSGERYLSTALFEGLTQAKGIAA